MKKKDKTKSKRGSALLIVLTIVVSMSALLTVSVTGGLQQAFFATRLADRVRAQLIAEAGAHEAYTILKADWDERLSDTAFPSTSFGGGTYDVRVVPTNAMASIRSTGTYGSARELAILDVINLGTTSPGVTVNWSVISNYTIVAGGQITWTGASQFLGNGALHSNAQFTRSGNGYVDGNVTSSTQFHTQGNANGINGTVSAPIISGPTSKISGTRTVGAVALVTIPDIDLTPYATEAAANGEYYVGDVTLSGGEDPDGGVMFVEGNLTIAGNDNYLGSYICTGTLTISGNGSLTAVNGYPVLASRDGNINFAGQKDVTGLIYVKSGNYQQTGGNTLNGQIVVKGDISKAGNSMVGNFLNSPPTIPDGGGSSETELGLNAWQR